jgi:DNA-binding NarL/FixJ family response regulator
MPNHRCAIRTFLAALLSDGRGYDIPGKLVQLAESVVRHDGLTSATADDLVSELLRRLVDHDKRQLRDDLERLNEPALARVYAHRLRQIALEERPRWPLLRALRDHVRRALEAGLPREVGLPVSLERHCQLQPPLVAAAAACLVAGGTPARTNELASRLLLHYYGPEVDAAAVEDLVSQTPAPDVLVELHRDGHVAAREMRDALDPRQQRVLSRTCSGQTLTDIARDERVAVATAFAWRCAVSDKLAAVASRLDVGPDTLAYAIELLEAA